jgi:predicted AAA+ superfamily ATPase
MAVRETARVSVLRGGFPEVVAAPRSARLWFASYLQTYLERDVRAVTAVRALSTFRRFLALLASRHGQVLNKSDLAAPLGVSVPTVTQWLSVLEITAQIALVPPFYENLGKRLIKSPKLYVADSGLACHLLGVDTQAELEKSPFLGSLFEGFVAGEILKAQANAGRRRELYYFRDQQGLEVDFVVPGKGGALRLIEVKTTHTPTPEMAASLQRLAIAVRRRRRVKTAVELLLVHRQPKTPLRTSALAPGVRAVGVEDFVQQPLS